MLYDPRHDYKPFDFLSPSLEGFTAFVGMKVDHDPDGRYDWSNCRLCAVGQYLWTIGAFDSDWRHPDNALLMMLDEVAEGGTWRDDRGRFTNEEEEVAQWTWKALAARLDQVWLEIAR